MDINNNVINTHNPTLYIIIYVFDTNKYGFEVFSEELQKNLFIQDLYTILSIRYHKKFLMDFTQIYYNNLFT